MSIHSDTKAKARRVRPHGLDAPLMDMMSPSLLATYLAIRLTLSQYPAFPRPANSDTKAKGRRVRPHGLENEPPFKQINVLLDVA
jgi:hypothetical protein